jgi:L-threonylcarbamoyladenylate synthase
MHIFNSLHDNTLTALIKNGAVGVVPTDTVYGLVAPVADVAAVMWLYQLKSRERKPGTVIAANIEQLAALGLDRQKLSAVAPYWPAPLSVVIDCGETLAYVHQGVGSLAVRIPAYTALRNLLEITGPLLTSSANQPGEPPANNLTEAKNYFGDQVDFYVDGEDAYGSAPSTVIRVHEDNGVTVLRAGAVNIDKEE